MIKIILMDIYGCFHEKDRETFRISREAIMGRSLEDFSNTFEVSIQSFISLLEPIQETLNASRS